jgi:LacI family transcriptional regulator, repressor for deo operon, udp, cdd, tsx, nupC, and nupG
VLLKHEELLLQSLFMRTSETTSVTIRDVASRAGVSIGTVSRALKNQGGLTEETRQQVLRSALELGYDTSNLRPKKLRRISFLTSRLPDLTHNPFYSPVLHGVEDACRDEEIVLSYTSLRPGDRAVEIVRRHEADGLLCAGYFEPKLIERIAAIGLPLVLIDHFSPGITSVNIDNIHGAKKAVTHLLQKGYQRIAFMGGPNHHSIQQRLYGFRQALFEAGVPADPTLEITPDPAFTPAGTTAAMHYLLKLEPRPDAVFVVNDLSALWAMQLCLEAGLRIPEDIAFVGFDDIHAASHAHPPLTTVRVNKELLGRWGVEALLARRTSETLIETELIVRGSSVAKSFRKQTKK